MDAALEGTTIVRLYAAATGEASWTSALEAIAAGIGARTVVLVAQPARAPEATLLGAVGIGAEALGLFHGTSLHRQAASLDDRAAAPACASLTGPRLLCCSVDVEVNGRVIEVVHLVALRPHDDVAFGAEERDAVSRLVPHLSQACRTASRLVCWGALRTALRTVGDRLGKGIALLDAACQVVVANETLERICADADGLTIRRGVLTPSRSNEVAFARLAGGISRGDNGGRLDVVRPSGCPPYSLLMSPVRPDVPAIGAASARIVVVVTDPARSCGGADGALALTYGLTRAESRMVAHLVAGATVSATAEHLGISLNTARTHLKRAMAKTGVSRQTDLVRLLLSRQ